jgi:hypothetical protein
MQEFQGGPHSYLALRRGFRITAQVCQKGSYLFGAQFPGMA